MLRNKEYKHLYTVILKVIGFMVQALEQYLIGQIVMETLLENQLELTNSGQLSTAFKVKF